MKCWGNVERLNILEIFQDSYSVYRDLNVKSKFLKNILPRQSNAKCGCVTISAVCGLRFTEVMWRTCFCFMNGTGNPEYFG